MKPAKPYPCWLVWHPETESYCDWSGIWKRKPSDLRPHGQSCPSCGMGIMIDQWVRLVPRTAPKEAT